MKKFNAFTLAEVLITLGIIGVVAAMTMPTLMNQTNGAQYKAAYKKALSALSQAITLNMALDDVNFASITEKGTAGETSGTGSLANILNSRMNIVKAATAAQSGYDTTAAAKIQAVKPCEGSETTGSGVDAKTTCKAGAAIAPDTFLFFNDGIMFAFKNDDVINCTDDNLSGSTRKHCYGIIDVNGTKGPNKEVACDTVGAAEANCKVSNPTDIYPVEFYDQTVLPASPAGKVVLYGK